MTDKKPMPDEGDNFKLIGPVAREVVEKLKQKRGNRDGKPTQQPKR